MKLPRPITRQLEDWILANYDRFAKEGLTRADVAGQVGQFLKTTITVAHVSGAMRAISKEWPTSRPKGDDRLTILANSIRYLYVNSGQSIPSDLDILCKELGI